MAFSIVEDTLDAQTYYDLRKKVNFKEYALEDVKIALEHNLFSVVVYDEKRPIGIARIVGDDRIVFFIKDVVVDPAYQKQKIGDILMKAMFGYIEKKACDEAYIGLMSTPECTAFYEQYGFIKRPSKGLGPGMVKFFIRAGG